MNKYHVNYNPETGEVIQICNAEKQTLPKNTIPVDEKTRDRVISSPHKYKVIDRKIVYVSQPDPVDLTPAFSKKKNQKISGYVDKEGNCWLTDDETAIMYMVAFSYLMMNPKSEVEVPCIVDGKYIMKKINKDKSNDIVKGLYEVRKKAESDFIELKNELMGNLNSD